MVDSTTMNNNNRHSIDIRAFVAILVAAMALSFGAGVGLGPTAEQLLVAKQSLPPVTSVDLSAQAAQAQSSSDDLHEPAGQVCFIWIVVVVVEWNERYFFWGASERFFV